MLHHLYIQTRGEQVHYVYRNTPVYCFQQIGGRIRKCENTLVGNTRHKTSGTCDLQR